MPQDEEQKPVLNTSMDELTAGEELPEVKENAIEAVKQSEEANEAGDATVGEGDGAEKKKPETRGRKKGGKNKKKDQPFYAGDASAPHVTAAQAESISSRQAAIAISGLIEVAGAKLISDEWNYTPMERELNVNAWEKTFDHYGGVNLTPPMELALSHAQIIVSRAIGGKETRGKLQLAWMWAKNKWRSRSKDTRGPETEGEAA